MVISRAFVFILLFLIVLNPYTIVGPIGSYLAIILASFFFFSRSAINFISSNVLPITILLFISLWGVLMSVVNDIGQTTHFKAVVSLLVTFLAGFSLCRYCKKRSIHFDDICFLLFLVIISNGIVIFLQVQFPALRALVENFLVPAGNIDWTQGFRYRGLASAGGASLSLLMPVGALLAMYLYERRRIGVIFLFLGVIILFFSGLLIGRTGTLLLVAVTFGYTIRILFMNFRKPKFIIYSLFSVVIFVMGLAFSYGLIMEYLSSKYGSEFLSYAIGFMMEGKEGFESEGTVSILADYIKVVPSAFPEIFLGFGYYGGTDFYLYSDSGYARMLLSVGWIFAPIFYFFISGLYFLGTQRKHLLLLLGVFFILLVAEFKEPLLYSGYASRILVLISVFSSFSFYRSERWKEMSVFSVCR